MGEIAEMMLDGTMCAGCGEYLEKEPMGFPDYCSSCRPASHRWEERIVPIGEKQAGRLRRLREMTDSPLGDYPGCKADEAPAKYRALVKLGYADYWVPQNPIHKTRVVITELGRKALNSMLKS